MSALLIRADHASRTRVPGCVPIGSCSSISKRSPPPISTASVPQNIAVRGRWPSQTLVCYRSATGVDFRPRPASLQEQSMSKFVISPHLRMQEWVAEEKGYFAAEELYY